MSKTTKKTTTEKPAAIPCNNTACKFCGITGFCFAKPGYECPDGKIKAPAQVQEPAKVQEPTTAPVKTKATEPVKSPETPKGHEPAPVVKKTLSKIKAAMERKPEPVKAKEPAHVKKSPYTDHLADWKDDTARNLHTEVRFRIAAWCRENATAEVEEFALLMADYQYIQDESTNGITTELQDFRLEIDAELFERIKRVFGEKAATEIHGCL